MPPFTHIMQRAGHSNGAVSVASIGLLTQRSQVGQAAVALIKVKSIADHEFVRTLKCVT